MLPSTSSNTQQQPQNQLDLSSAIEYNHYLINSYLEERNSRELPLYQQILQESRFKDQTVPECEQTIIDEIRRDFFLERNLDSESEDDDDETDSEEDDLKNIVDSADSKLPDAPDSSSSIAKVLQTEPCDSYTTSDSITTAELPNQSITTPGDELTERSEPDVTLDPEVTSNLDPTYYTQSQIIERCILSQLPQFDSTDLTLQWIDQEKRRLTKEVTIVSKRLTDLIVENEEGLGEELKRVMTIDGSLKNAINICGDGMVSLDLWIT